MRPSTSNVKMKWRRGEVGEKQFKPCESDEVFINNRGARLSVHNKMIRLQIGSNEVEVL